jgi:flagellar biosynthesis GTPase FlhF
MAVLLMLEFATGGWHVRWRTPSTDEFNRVREAFKEELLLEERYWIPWAFEDKGGWWVAYGALERVGHLFANYRSLRDQMEQAHWAEYERQRQEAQVRAEQERLEEEARRERKRQQQRERRQRQKEKKAEEPRKPQPKHESIKLPKTFDEALALLKLTYPVTRDKIKKAYWAQAQVAHPDHGGSHAAMVRLNAAYELALAAF